MQRALVSEKYFRPFGNTSLRRAPVKSTRGTTQIAMIAHRPSSGSIKPPALTRPSREGSNGCIAAFFLPARKIQMLSALPFAARTNRRFSVTEPAQALFLIAFINLIGLILSQFRISVKGMRPSFLRRVR